MTQITATLERCTVPEVRRPAHREHLTRPAGGIEGTEWAIETQLDLAYEADTSDAYSVLACFNPGMRQQVLDGIDELLDRADLVAEHWAQSGRAWRMACDEYRDQLRTLAKLLGGTR